MSLLGNQYPHPNIKGVEQYQDVFAKQVKGGVNVVHPVL